MDLPSQLRAAIIAQSLPVPSSTFLKQLITSRTPPPPITSLVATAKARLLACDLASGGGVVDPSNPGLPPGIDSATIKEVKLPWDVHVQVLDVENLTQSRWEQVEELEAIEKGERTRGRQVIRVTTEDDENGEHSQTQGTQRSAANTTTTGTPSAGLNATHRLVLQDGQGKRIFAVELRRIPRIGVGKTLIGEKMLVRAGTVVARGTVLLSPESCVLLGGKIDAWHDAWVEGRLERLRESVGADRPS